jgi:hypothetical protein
MRASVPVVGWACRSLAGCSVTLTQRPLRAMRTWTTILYVARQRQSAGALRLRWKESGGRQCYRFEAALECCICHPPSISAARDVKPTLFSRRPATSTGRGLQGIINATKAIPRNESHRRAVRAVVLPAMNPPPRRRTTQLGKRRHGWRRFAYDLWPSLRSRAAKKRTERPCGRPEFFL